MASTNDKNKLRLVSFFESGIKEKRETGRLGVEVEHHVLANDGSAIGYEPADGHMGIRDLLVHLSTWYPKQTHSATHELIGLEGSEGSVTLEPAAQLEFSVAPYTRIADVERAYRSFRNRIDDYFAPRCTLIEEWGYNPRFAAQDLKLIPKKRYAYMDAYFASIGSHGDRMMRASASTQVSIDFYSEADAVRKMRVAAALAPILAAITDNTPIYEAQPNHTPIRRLQLWREVDRLRCGTIPELFDEGYGFASYAEWLLRTPPIFILQRATDSDVETSLPFFTQTAAEAYGDTSLTVHDMEHLISMFWPDVRLKHFVEVRPADCMPIDQVLGYTALVKGIFYSDASLEALEEELGVSASVADVRAAWPIEARDVEDTIRQIQSQGFDGLAYGKPLQSWEAMLFALARAALPGSEQHYLVALESFAKNKPWWQTKDQA